MSLGTNALRVLVKGVDLKVLANGIFDEVLEVALDKVVKDSSNTIDDTIMPIIWPLLEKEVKKLIDEKLDLATLLKLDEAESTGDAPETTPEA